MTNEKRVVLVTGANAGIGFELSRMIAAEGHKVWMAARNPASGEEAAAILKQEGLDVKFVTLDVIDLASIVAAKEVVEKEDGGLDVLVNNAGIGQFDKDQNALTVDLKTIRDSFETNFYGTIRTTQTFLPLLKAAVSAKGHAVILNVSTDMASNAFQARPGSMLHMVAYNTSKAAANSYTIALSKELTAQHIKVNAVTPGFTSTKLNFFRKGGKDAKAGAQSLLAWALVDKDGATGLFIDEHGKETLW